MISYALKVPRIVYSGSGALNYLKDIINSEISKVAVFTDKGIRAAGLLEKPLQLIKEMDVDYVIVDEISTEPTCDDAQCIIERFRQEKANMIVAIGGGSVMDIAKLASVLAGSKFGVRDLLVNPSAAVKSVPLLMIPTTAGTGSEATPNSIVSVPEKELKVGIIHDAMIPDCVILDGEMIRNLPKKIAASTGLDALAHAIECYTSNKANMFSDTFALEALNLIFHNIEEACNNPDAMEAKNAMLIAAFYAGIAITASGTTAVHALSYPLGGKYHIPHGIANAMLLVPVMKFNEAACRDRLAKIYDRIKHDEEPALTEREKSLKLMMRLNELVKKLEIPCSLKEYGVDANELDNLVKSGMEVKRLLNNNRKVVTEEDARKIYLEIL